MAFLDQCKTSVSSSFPPNTPATSAFDEFIAHFRQTMVDAGMTRAGNPERMLVHIRRIFQRAGLSPRDIAIVRGFLSKAQVAMGTRRKTRRKGEEEKRRKGE